jgi:hypothetical protein
MFYNIVRSFAAGVVVFTFAATTSKGEAHKSSELLSPSAVSNVVSNFDEVAVGGLPQGWMIDSTNLRGGEAIWKVVKDKSAPSGDQVLALTKTNHGPGGTFNLCRMDKVKLLNGEIEVSFKAVGGRGDQGGGIMWRVLDGNNYNVARFNPLEDNLRVYYVRKGVRRMIKGCTIELPAGKWQKMRIVFSDSSFECYLNGKLMLKGENPVFTKAGGVGLWTKADAVTSFDDFKFSGK